VICSDGFGGVERYVSTLAPLLADRGHEVCVIGGAASEMSAALGTAGRFLPAASMRDARTALAHAGSFDLLNTHMTEADLVGLMRGRGLRSARHVSTRHFAAPRGHGATRRILRRWEHRIDTEIAISEFVASHAGVRADIVLTGVANAEAATHRRPVVLVAQRLEPEKDTHVAVRAWAASDARRQGWRMEIAGDGSLRAELQREAIALHVDDTVGFVGYRSDVAQLMDSSSILLAPTAREGLGIAVVEAMSHALPVIASAGGGHLETVGKVGGAALFPPGDHAAAAARIDELVAETEDRAAYGRRLQDFQRSELSVDRWVERTLAVYERTLAR
jgi:glycosyltransferase involved in cell wall biosynthesis